MKIKLIGHRGYIGPVAANHLVRALPGAEISILLTGNVEVQGFGHRRELKWSDDLDAGVNQLSLPLVASGEGGGQMVVRLSHPDSEQLFVIDLPLDSEVS